jgi:acetyltransferase
MKAGRTREGARAAASHTGGLAEVDLATDLIFEKAGILSFRDEGELCRAAMAFATQPIPAGNRVGMMTNTGGPAVIAIDVLAAAGLEAPPLSEGATEVLQQKLLPEASIGNPLDVLATAGADHFRTALDAMVAEEQLDSLYINLVTPFFVDTDSVAREIVDVNKEGRKPIICNLMTDKRQWTETLRILRDGGVPCYSYPGEAARALVALTRYQKVRSRELGRPVTFDDVDRGKAEEILQGAAEAGRKFLSAVEVYRVLAAYGIVTAGWRVVDNADQAEQAAEEIGYPVVVKADSESIVHKSDLGGVAMDLKDSSAVCAAIEEMKGRLGTKGMRFLVQEYLPGGMEIIIGAKAEEELGHLVMFGLGGIYVEVLDDVVFRLSPVTTVEVREMLSSIKAAPLLEGVRGEKGVDQRGIEEIIQRLSQLVTDMPVIQEVDLNPVMAFGERVAVVDARIAL